MKTKSKHSYNESETAKSLTVPFLYATPPRLLFLQRLKISIQVGDALLHLYFVALAHAPEYRSPDRHFLIPVRHQTGLSAQNTSHFVRGIFSAIAFREPS